MFLNVSDCQLLLIKRPFMERSVAVGSASGVASSIALALLRTLTFDPAALERPFLTVCPRFKSAWTAARSI